MKIKTGDTVFYYGNEFEVTNAHDDSDVITIEDDHRIYHVFKSEVTLFFKSKEEVDLSLDTDKLKNPIFKQCECGAASLGYTTHMDYCPKVGI